MTQVSKRAITAQDLYRFKLVTASEISPDGKWVIYEVQRVDPKTEKKYSNLWLVSTSEPEPKQFTFGDQVDEKPKWSPDGTRIAFLSQRGEDKHPQIYLIRFQGGEAHRLTDLNGEIEEYSWSPDGKQFVLQYRKLDPDALERDKDEAKNKLGVVAHHIDRVFFKLDDFGYLPHERYHIWLVDSNTGKASQLTYSSIHDELDPAWSPDSTQVAYISNRTTNPDLDPDELDLFVYYLKSSKETKIATYPGVKSLPSFSPDGTWIAYIGQEGKHVEYKNNNLWLVPANGSGPARNITGKYDIHLNPTTINDMGTPRQESPTWSEDNSRLFFQIQQHGNTLLMSIGKDGENLQKVVNEPGVVAQFSFDLKRENVAYLLGEMYDPGQLWVMHLPTKTCRQLTHLNRELLDQFDLGEIEEVWYTGAVNNRLQGWIMKPPNFDPEKKYPAILEIHGGPLLQYGNFFMHEFFYLAAAGYVIFFTNPRGGQGYGEEHAKAIYHGRWGTADYDDLMAWTDYIVKLPYIDSKRLGVTGGSYGGYMTNWIIGHTHRFKAAITARSVSNLLSMWGSSDFNWQFQETFDNKAPYESIDVLWEESPIKHFANARTPTLVIHSEKDYRCPIEQGEQVYVALKKLGIDSEMIVFPDEPHGLSRTGRTDRRIARLEHMLRWFDKYLK